MVVHSPLVGSCASLEIIAFADFLFGVYYQLGLVDSALQPLDSHYSSTDFRCLFA